MILHIPLVVSLAAPDGLSRAVGGRKVRADPMGTPLFSRCSPPELLTAHCSFVLVGVLGKIAKTGGSVRAGPAAEGELPFDSGV